MPNHNRRPAECPGWGWIIIQEMRTFSREAAEDRKLAAEDRKLAAEDRKLAAVERRQLHEDLREIGEHIKLLAEAVIRTNELVASQHGHLIQMSHDIKSIAVEQKEHTKTLHDILRTLRIQGNGRRNNGRGNGRR